MKRREFVSGLFGTTLAWPVGVRAQQSVPMRRVGVLINRTADNQDGQKQVAALQTALQELGLKHGGNLQIDVRWGGLIVTPSASEREHRDLIIALAARYKVPAVYAFRTAITAGGLIGYGPDVIDQFRRAAPYIDRILKGERSADLPVQTPTKFELVINMRTAKALGLQIPQALLATADEVIE